MYQSAFNDELANKRLSAEELNHLQTQLKYRNGSLVMSGADLIEAIASIKFILASFPYSAVVTRFAQFDTMQQLLFSPLDDLEVNTAKKMDLYYEQKKLEIEDKRNQQFDVEAVGDKCTKCGSTNTQRKVIQTRSGDEPEKVVDTCGACGWHT